MTETRGPDDLKTEVEAWYFEHIEKAPYSDALRELIKLLDYDEWLLRKRREHSQEAHKKVVDLEEKLEIKERELEQAKEDLAAFKQH